MIKSDQTHHAYKVDEITHQLSVLQELISPARKGKPNDGRKKDRRKTETDLEHTTLPATLRSDHCDLG
jgi:hypothetical protein